MNLRRLFGRRDRSRDEDLNRLASRLGDPPVAAGASGGPETPGGASTPEAGVAGSRGALLVVRPDGEQTRLLLSRRPVAIGSSETLADIILDDDAIEGVHLRVTPLPGDEFRVHGLSRRSVRPYGTNRQQPAEFTLIAAGDQLSLDGAKGRYVIHFLASHADEPEEEPAIEVRPLGFDEAADFRELRLRAVGEAPDAYGTLYEEAMQITAQAWEQRYRRVFADGVEQMYVVGEPGELFGCARVSIEGEEKRFATVTQMWVNPERRRSGAGSLLLAACEQWARDHRCTAVELGVTDTNTMARAFFENAGYVRTGEVEPLRRGSPLRTEQLLKSLTS